MNNMYKQNEIEITRVGLGCMRMSISEKSTRKESIATIHAALDAGINLLNTGDFYGKDGHNELLIGEALKGRDRDKAFISLKYGTFGQPTPDGLIDVGPKRAREKLTASLKRLKLDYVDLYQPARVDMGIPLEDTIGAISRLVDEGLVKHIGLSEVDPNTLKRAHAIHPIRMVEMEYSILHEGIEADLIPVARENGIGVVAFGALGLGRLFNSPEDPLPMMISQIATEKNITSSQFAHAWLYAKGEHVLPLIGARTRAQLEDSLKCVEVTFTQDEVSRINTAMKESNITGTSMPKMIIRNGRIERL